MALACARWIADGIDEFEVALLACVLATALASARRLARLAGGTHVPARFRGAMDVLSAVPTRDLVRRRLAASAAIRSAIGVGTILPTLAQTSPLWGAIEFVATLSDSSWSDGRDTRSREELLAWLTSVSLPHVAFGIALSVAAASAHAALVAGARRVAGSRWGHPMSDAAVRTVRADRVSTTALHWNVAGFVGAMATVVNVCFSTVEFYPTYALNVDAGVCASGAPTLRTTSDHRVHRVDSRGIVVATTRSIDAARLVRREEIAVALHVEDGVRYAETVPWERYVALPAAGSASVGRSLRRVRARRRSRRSCVSYCVWTCPASRKTPPSWAAGRASAGCGSP